MFLLDGQLSFCSLIIFSIAALAGFPCNTGFVLLVLVWLDLDLKERDQKKRQGMVLQVAQKAMEDLTILFYKYVVERVIFLLHK